GTGGAGESRGCGIGGCAGVIRRCHSISKHSVPYFWNAHNGAGGISIAAIVESNVERGGGVAIEREVSARSVGCAHESRCTVGSGAAVVEPQMRDLRRQTVIVEEVRIQGGAFAHL